MYKISQIKDQHVTLLACQKVQHLPHKASSNGPNAPATIEE